MEKFKSIEAFDALFEHLGAEQIVTLTSNRFVARLKEPRLTESFIALFEKFAAKQVVTLMSQSFASRVEKLRFMESSMPC